MHIANAHIIARSADNETLRDIFEATSEVGRYLSNYPRDTRDQYVSIRDADTDLSTLIGKVEHSENFRQRLSLAFDNIADWVLSDREMPERINYWDLLSTRERLNTCSSFNQATVGQLRTVFVSPLSFVDSGPAFSAERPQLRTKSLTTAEDFSVSIGLTPPRFANRMAINIHPEGGFADPYKTLKNLSIGNIHLLMETLSRDVVYRWNPPELARDKELWEALKKHNGFVPDIVQPHFHQQFFRRAWEPAVNGMCEKIKTGMERIELGPPPTKTFMQRVAGAFGLNL